MMIIVDKRTAVVFLLLIRLFFRACFLYADPADPSIKRIIKLKDGMVIEAKLVGNEYGHYWYAEKNKKAYVRHSNSDFYVEADGSKLMADARARSRKATSEGRSLELSNNAALTTSLPFGTIGLSGVKRALAILVEFPDRKFQDSHTPNFYGQLLNGLGEETRKEGLVGSVREYFLEQSNGLLDLSFDVIGPVCLSHEADYYGWDEDEKHKDVNFNEAGIEICRLASQLVDFSHYDWDGNGVMAPFAFIYAGLAQSSGGSESTIWPKKTSYMGEETFNGITPKDLCCAAELRKNGGKDIVNGIGTFCHEYSHCIGLPDSYDYNNVNYGTNQWDVMGNGGHNNAGRTPAGYTALGKMLCGWLMPTELSTDTVVNNMEPLNQGGSSYIISNKNCPTEFFLVENRQKVGFDAALPGQGMLIMHVDYDDYSFRHNAVNTNQERAKWVLADNSSKGSDVKNDTYPFGNNDSFTNTSTPNAELYYPNIDGTNLLSKPITGIIQNSDGTIGFRFQNNMRDWNYERKMIEKSISLSAVGTLESSITSKELLSINSLKLSGDLNGNDILMLRKMSGIDDSGNVSIRYPGVLSVLDLSNCNIVDGGKRYSNDTEVDDLGTKNAIFPQHAFDGTILKKISLPASATEIGRYALASCSQLEAVEIGSNIRYIGFAAFFNSVVRHLSFGDNLESMDVSTCYKAKNLESVSFGNKLRILPRNTFRECSSLKDVTLGKNTLKLENRAFGGCTSLERITFPEHLQEIGTEAFMGAVNLGEVTSRCVWPIKIENDAFDELTYNKARLLVPYGTARRYKQLQGWRNFSDIREMAKGEVPTFEEQVVKIDVPSPGSLQQLAGEERVRNAMLLKITGKLNGSDILVLRTLGGRDIDGKQITSGLSYLDLSGAEITDGGVKYINDNEVSADGTFSGIFPNHAIASLRLSKVILPSSVKSIDRYCFAYCPSLEEVEYGDNVSFIDYAAFCYSSLESVAVGNGVTSMGTFVFFKMENLKQAKIGRNLTSLPLGTFQGCIKLSDVTLNDKLSSIDERAFADCVSLEKIAFPVSLGTIGKNAFANVDNLRTIISMSSHPSDIAEDAFSDACYSSAVLHVPQGATERYRECKGWQRFLNVVEDENIGLSVNSASDNCQTIPEVYSLRGERIPKGDKLQRGVYVINKKKVVVK